MEVDCGSARDRIGQSVGAYVLEAMLGAGGTAIVYRARAEDGRRCAVKILHDHLARIDEVCRRFVREGHLGNVLEHPGTVRVLDDGWTDDAAPYLILELLEGETLEERRERLGGRLELAETLEHCDQLLAVLELAHARSIVHRDIKPSNLFLTKRGQLKVLDFGIARLVDDTSSTSTKTGQTVGTPAFMPPEQALSKPRDVDARTDLWAVGATLFTLLSGEHVHVAESSSEHLVKAATLHARSLAKALVGVPTNVEAFVARSLAFDKDERWSSAAEMRAALAEVRSDPGRRIGISAMPPPDRTSQVPPLGSLAQHPIPPSWRTPAGLELPLAPTVVESSGVTAEPPRADEDAKRDRARRRGLLPLLLASTSLLVVMSAAVVVLAVRTPKAAPVAVVASPPYVPPPPSIVPLEPSASAAPSSAPVALPSSSVTRKPVLKKAPPSHDAKKDLYKPF